MSEDGITITEEGVTFSPPTATGSARGIPPGLPFMPEQEGLATEAPLYVVVMHDGVEVLYKKVGD